MKLSSEQKIFLLQIIFITSMILANVIGIKIVNIGPVAASIGTILVPISFLITDILSEVKGKKHVYNLVWFTVVALVFSYLFIQLSVIMAPADRFAETNSAFVTIFSGSARIFLASIVAFLISQFHDLWAFEFWKAKTKGRFLWLRNNLSTMVSQAIDTVIFMFLAFYQLTPQFDAAYVWELTIPYYILKIILAFLDTPFVYLGVKWLRPQPGLESNEKKHA